MNDTRSQRFSYGPVIVMLGAIVFLLAAVWSKGDPDVTHGRTTVSSYTVATIDNVPSTIPASTTASNVAWIDVRRHSSIDVALTAAAATTNPGGSGLIVAFYRSLDGVTADPTALASAAVPVTGVNSVLEITNLTGIGNSGWLKATFQNAATSALAGVTVKIVGKPPWALTYPYGGGP